MEIVDKGTNKVVYPTSSSDFPYVSENILEGSRQILLSNFSFNGSGVYKLRRKINKANSSTINFLNGNNSEITDVQNLYIQDEKFAYVASNSLPSIRDNGLSEDFLYGDNIKLIQQSVFSGSGFFKDKDFNTNAYTTISFEDSVEFITGDKIFYEASTSRLRNIDRSDLEDGEYYVKVVDSNSIKIFNSFNIIDNNDFCVKFYSDSGDETPSGKHTLTLASQNNKLLSGSKILRKFPIPSNTVNGESEKTIPSSTVGMLVNGTEISNYKSGDKIYYGPVEEIRVLNGGKDYDVIDLPEIKINGGSEEALAIPVITGTIKDINVIPQEFDIEQVADIQIDGGNFKDVVLEPVLVKRRRELLFDARTTTQGGGIGTETNQLLFLEDHNLFTGQKIVYFNNGNPNLSIGIGSSTLINNEFYFASVDNNKTIQLHETFDDAINETNPIEFGGSSFVGSQKFKTADFKNTLTEIKIINSGSFTNRQLFVKSSGISTSNSTINFKDHEFSTGDVVEYFIDPDGSTISGLSTTNRYYVLVNDKDSFQLCNAGIGNTIISNFERKNIVKFSSEGSGYQKFKYPDIKITVNFSPVGTTVESTKTVEVSPVIKGSIEKIYVYSGGLGYGSKTLNFNKIPEISVLNGKEAIVKPNIVLGVLLSTNIEFSGFEYFSVPDLEVFDPTGKGSGAKLKANITDGKISSVTIINKGRNYSNETKIIVKPRGIDGLFEAKIRSLTVNSTEKRSNLYYNLKNKDSGLQFTFNGYSKPLRDSFGEVSSVNSGIIGWAYDGNPIYGPYGLSDPSNENSATKTLIPGYVLDTSKVIDRPSDFSAGFFVEDYFYNNSGDLDERNGRFEKTTEFPNGVYAYHATIDSITSNPVFPYFIGNTFRSKFIPENKNLNQEFNFEDFNLIRNTFPYKITEKFSGYDFVTESKKYLIKK